MQVGDLDIAGFSSGMRMCLSNVYVEIKQSGNRPGVAQRVPRVLDS